MKKGKKNSVPTPPPPRTIRGTDEDVAKRAEIRIEREIQLVKITGGIIGIAALIWSGFAYGIELPVILFMIVLSNNLCNVK